MTTLTNLNALAARLRRKNRGRYALLVFCTLFSVTLITAYSLMMFAPTVRDVLPEGGDSRKQLMMIYALTVLGCAVFTTYAASLFFREKSRETGLFLALGASRRRLAGVQNRELGATCLFTSLGGALLGIALAAGIWQLFRTFVVDSAEMALVFDLRAYGYVAVFVGYAVAMLFFLGRRAVYRTNVIDVIRESHKSEPIRAVPRWYGRVGLVLVAAGAVLGYFMPTVFVRGLHWYAPGFVTAIFFAPALLGLCMVLLHTVANGWGRKGKRYKDIISVSMMKFQARQTVRNMLVMTLLIAGAYFASFYAPMMMGSAATSSQALPIDYLFHYRQDQDMLSASDIRALAEDHDVTITDYHQAPMARLAVDGEREVEHETPLGTTYDLVYEQQLQSNLFLSESGYAALSGETVDVAPGTLAEVYNSEGFDDYELASDVSLVTNTITGQTLSVAAGPVLTNDSLLGHYVLDDGDFARMSEGLTPQWRETLVAFDVADPEASLPFARALYDAIVDHSNAAVEVVDAWDPVARARDIAETGTYWADPENAEANGFGAVRYDARESTDFRTGWLYAPSFRVLDEADMLKTYAVFIMIFVFIAIVCFAAVFVIAYTRCLTIALASRRVYDDLRHLGAPRAYLLHSAQSQVRRVFLVPAALGTVAISGFYGMMMFFNDGRLTSSEITGLALCGLVVVAVSALLWGFYRVTRRKVCGILGLS